MSEVSHWFRIIVVNIVSRAKESPFFSSRSMDLDSCVLHDLSDDAIDRDEHDRQTGE